MASAVFKTVGDNLLPRQVQFLLLPNKTMNNKFRNIPQIDKLMMLPELEQYIKELGRNYILNICRMMTSEYRLALNNNATLPFESFENEILRRCNIELQKRLQPVINATGVLLHTNFGRAPLGRDIFLKAADELAGYCNLEFDLADEARGRRAGFTEALLANSAGCESSLVVNNNAAALFLILKTFSQGFETVVSRGELVQIGGGFRIPDIMSESGAILREVGTTNITRLYDYENAINDNSRIILSVHRSNFKITGFNEEPLLKELATLKKENLILVRDLGSGLPDFPADGFYIDSIVKNELQNGADLVCISGDKLLGSCQSGLIFGKKVLIDRIRKHPLYRALRVDKITSFVLQESLVLYANNNMMFIPFHQLLNRDVAELNKMADSIIDSVHNNGNNLAIKKTECNGTIGGGSLPGEEFPSIGLSIESKNMKCNELYSHFLAQTPPIAGIISNDRFTLNLCSVFEKDLALLKKTITDLS